MERKRKQPSTSRSLLMTTSNSSTNLRLKHAPLKTKKGKHLKTAKLKTKYGKKQLREEIFEEVVTKKKKSTVDKAESSLNGGGLCQNVKKNSHHKKKQMKVDSNNQNCDPVAPQHVFVSNYQQLVLKAMDKKSKNEDILPVETQASFKNNYQHLVTNALCLEKTTTTKTKGSLNKAESITSMFRHGFSNAEVITTPNDKSHIPLCTDVGANRSVAEFSRCGRSGPTFDALSMDESDEDVTSFYNPLDQSTLTDCPLPNENADHFCVTNEVEEETVNIAPPPQIHFHNVPKNKYVVVMKHPACLFFQGQLKIRVLVGHLKVLGHTLTNACKESSVLNSPAGFSKLGLQTADSSDVSSELIIQSMLLAFGLSSKVAHTVVAGLNVNDCVVIIEQAFNPLFTYLSTHCEMHLYPRSTGEITTRPFFKEEKKLQCQFEYDSENIPKCHKEPLEWSHLANSIASSNQTNGPTRVMICGGKSVGKSTLLRFLINQSLATTEEVLYLDFDPGQAEFTVPGCVSVVRVQKPLLGPSFTHLLDPERMVYIGDVDMGKCPDRYIKSAQHIIDYCLSQPKLNQMAWFINTMGFNKGIGVDLTTNLISLVNPTQVVQIQSKSGKRNYPALLSSENVSKQRSALQQLLAPNHRLLNYSLHIIPSAAEEKQPGPLPEWGISPKMLRSIMVLAYFYGMLKPPRFSLTDIVPYKICFSKLKLGICHETVHYSQLLNVMNANLVALCVVPDDECVLKPDDPQFPQVLVQPQIVPCVGFGVVRGADIMERVLYLITPLPKERLKDVNCLLAGSVTLPASLYMHSTSGLGHVPYVALGSGQVTSNRLSRRFLPQIKQSVIKD